MIIAILLIFSLKRKWKKKNRNGQNRKLTEQNGGRKNVKNLVKLKYLNNFWRTIEMSLISSEISVILTWFENYFTIDTLVENQVPELKITDTKIYAAVVTLSTQDNAKLLQQFRSRFKRNINWNNNQSKVTIHEGNRYLSYLIDPSFQRFNRLLFYHLKIILVKQVTRYLLQVEIKHFNVMINVRNFFDQPVKNNFGTYDNFPKIETG